MNEIEATTLYEGEDCEVEVIPMKYYFGALCHIPEVGPKVYLSDWLPEELYQPATDILMKRWALRADKSVEFKLYLQPGLAHSVQDNS